MSTPLEIKTFEGLVGTSKVGKTKNWKIWVERFEDYSEIVTSHGYENMIESRRRILQGKNLNKSNQTTHFDQAISEAQSKWKKKNEIENYQTDHSSVKEKVYLPMLAQDYHKHQNKIKFPCYVQPKLDGYRMLFDTSNHKITTRQGKDFPIIQQSVQLWNELCRLPENYILDGELYVHGIQFESLGVLRKTKKWSDKDLEKLCKIEYHVYDLVDTQKTFEQRWMLLKSLIKESFEKIKLVPSYLCESDKEIKQYHENFTRELYEGTMIRNKEAVYLEKNRSYDLLKFKDFMDAEFEIVGYTFEKDTSGEDKNLIVWIVKTDKNVECNVRPKGVKEQRQELYEACQKDFTRFKGRKLWTKFFDYTSDGSLRFPTTKTSDVKSYIRDEIL
jgi:ATP-dependent DNA ligase